MSLPVIFSNICSYISFGLRFLDESSQNKIFGGLKFKFIGFANYLKVITNEKFWDALTYL